MLLSIKAGFTKDMIEDIGKGAILHDIGKIKLFSKYPNLCDPYHTYSFDEYELFKTHPYIGYENVEYNESISLVSKKIILLHHVWEDFDLSYSKDKRTYLSYPMYFRNNALSKEQKDETVCIVQASNINVNRFSIFNYIKENGVKIFGKYATNLLLKYISVYKVGDTVKLDDDRLATVIKHTDDVNKPIIQINNEEINLAENDNIKIVDIIDKENKGVKIGELRKNYYYL
jgi:hypothetical protein